MRYDLDALPYTFMQGLKMVPIPSVSVAIPIVNIQQSDNMYNAQQE